MVACWVDMMAGEMADSMAGAMVEQKAATMVVWLAGSKVLRMVALRADNSVEPMVER
jgi:hypothetical protein